MNARTRPLRRPLCWTAALALLAACGNTVGTATDAATDARTDAASTTELHRDCTDAGCASGQQCISAAAPGGATMTCEIRCTTDGECAATHRCNVPPVVPDSIPNVCVAR
jgi:hypothetical protein